MGFETAAVRGVEVHYGVRDTENSLGGELSTKGANKELVLTFDFDDLPSGSNAGLAAQLPANCSILSARLEVLTGFTSTSTTTDLLIGVTDADGGSNITDADGLIAAAEATQTAIATAGNIVTGAGAMVGTTIGAEAGVVTVAPSVDDLTAGKGRVVVEYVLKG